MGALRRVLLGVWGVIMCAAAVVVGAALINRSFAGELIDFLDDCFLYNMEQCFLHNMNLWLPIVVGLVLLLIGVLILTAACHRKRPPKQFTVATLDGGTVQVSFSAIDNVVKRAAATVSGASNINSGLQVDKRGLHIRLSMALASDVAVCEAGAQVRQTIAQQLDSVMGVTPASIDVTVTKVVDNGSLPPVRQEPQPAEPPVQEPAPAEQPPQPEVTENGAE